MTLTRFGARAVLASLMPLGAVAFIPHAAWADINVSTDMETAAGVADTLGALSTNTSAAATTSNVGILQSKVALLNAQIVAAQRTGVGQGSIAQLQATSNALQSIITKLQQGYTITDYSTTTSASDQIATVTIKFSNAATGSEVTQTSYIPPVADSSTDSGYDNSGSSGSSGSSSGSGFDGSDLLTSLLQQAGSQMGGGAGALAGAAGAMAGGGNPLSAIQPALDNIVSQSNAKAPVTAMDKCMSEKAAEKGKAVYDISAGKVYMPDGSVLDAHSGIGAKMDNPDYTSQKMSGPTPPGTYNLSMRKSRYFGVEALRLNPTDGTDTQGRDGLLAHTRLLRGGGQGSHGCVSFDDYAKFLAAFKSGQVKQLEVVRGSKGDKDKEKKECTPPTVNTPTPGAAPATPTS